MIGNENLQQHRTGGKDQRVFMLETANHEIKGFAHRSDVGGDIDRVGENQQAVPSQALSTRRNFLGVRSNALAGDLADFGADQLNGDHERRRKKHRPQQAETELRAGLRIGGYAGRVVVSGPVTKPGPSSRAVRVILAFVVARCLAMPNVRLRYAKYQCLGLPEPN